MKSNKPARRGVGRPRTEPKSAAQLQKEARESRLRTVQQKAELSDNEQEEILHALKDVNEKALREKTIRELMQMKAHYHRLWEFYLDNQVKEEAEQETSYGISISAFCSSDVEQTKMLTPQEWDDLHKEILTTPRKNARVTPSILNIQRSKFAHYGIALEPVETENIEELEAKQIQRKIKERQAEPKFTIGARLQDRTKPTQKAINKLWI